MSNTEGKNRIIKRRILSGAKEGRSAGTSIKASKAASIKHVTKNSANAGSKDLVNQVVFADELESSPKVKPGKVTFISPEEIEAASEATSPVEKNVIEGKGDSINKTVSESTNDSAVTGTPRKVATRGNASSRKSSASAKATSSKQAMKPDAVSSTESGPELIWTRADAAEPKNSFANIKWGLIIPALVVVLCMGLFVAASQAGWIQSFLTPEAKLIKETESSTEEETTTPPETTTEEETTTPPETTTEETTTAFQPSYYVIHANLAYNIVTVYTRGEKLNDGWDPDDPLDDEYSLDPVIAFTCSPGVNGATPTGRYYLQGRDSWCLMVGDVYTQYATRIVDDVMFHSIPYYQKDPGTLETDQYNILGYEASSACIRLNVRDAAWIFNYCAEGTEVDIYYDWDYYGPLNPEPIYQIPTDIPQLAGWDPTDVYSGGNPWMSYSAFLTNGQVTLPCNSSVESLLAAIGPTDVYGNNLSSHFYTDGGYSLWYPGTYTTTGHIDVGNLSYSFPLTITVTEEIAQEYYEDQWSGNDDWSGEDTWSEDTDWYAQDAWSEENNWEAQDTWSEENNWEAQDTWSEDTAWTGEENWYNENTWSEDTGYEYNDAGDYSADQEYYEDTWY